MHNGIGQTIFFQTIFQTRLETIIYLFMQKNDAAVEQRAILLQNEHKHCTLVYWQDRHVGIADICLPTKRRQIVYIIFI
jgi:hypothetical protein